jgi:ribosomal protein L11 methyltransferase
VPAPPALPALTIVIAPSTGFGTGHHATTRMCLAALQTLDLSGRAVLDVGTGSGILAIAACALGAREAFGIDEDPDAIRAASENLALNPGVKGVVVGLGDLSREPLPAADVITANLTGALLQRTAATLLNALRPGGRLIVSGLLREERDDVLRAFARATIVWEEREEEWTGLMFKTPGQLVE